MMRCVRLDKPALKYDLSQSVLTYDKENILGSTIQCVHRHIRCKETLESNSWGSLQNPQSLGAFCGCVNTTQRLPWLLTQKYPSCFLGKESVSRPSPTAHAAIWHWHMHRFLMTPLTLFCFVLCSIVLNHSCLPERLLFLFVLRFSVAG